MINATFSAFQHHFWSCSLLASMSAALGGSLSAVHSEVFSRPYIYNIVLDNRSHMLLQPFPAGSLLVLDSPALIILIAVVGGS